MRELKELYKKDIVILAIGLIILWYGFSWGQTMTRMFGTLIIGFALGGMGKSLYTRIKERRAQ